MLSVGLAHSIQEIISPLRNTGLVIRSLIANFVLVPLLTLLIIWFVGLEESYGIGLILLAMAAGAPFLITLTAASRGNMAMSAGLLTLLLTFTIVYMPLVAPLLLEGVAISSTSIALSLTWSMLIPFCLGLLITHNQAKWAQRLQRVASRVSSSSLMVLVVTMVLVHHRAIRDLFGTGAILAALALTVGAFIIGYILGGRNVSERGVVGLATSQRNVAAASIVAAQDFNDPNVLVMVIVTSLVALFILFPVAWFLRKQNTRIEHGHPVGQHQRLSTP